MTGKPGLEATKWLAFALMLGDHVNALLLHYSVGVLYLLGRLVFPLFALALGEGLAGGGELRANDCLRRLALWACVAQVPWSFFDSYYSLNVLFTLGAGLAVWLAANGSASTLRRISWGVGAAFVAVFCEYGIAGVALVVAALWWRERQSNYSLAAVALGTALLYVPNHSWFAMLAVPVFLAMRHAGELPRARHWFYPMYAAQFAVIAFVAWRVGA